MGLRGDGDLPMQDLGSAEANFKELEKKNQKEKHKGKKIGTKLNL